MSLQLFHLVTGKKQEGYHIKNCVADQSLMNIKPDTVQSIKCGQMNKTSKEYC